MKRFFLVAYIGLALATNVFAGEKKEFVRQNLQNYLTMNGYKHGLDTRGDEPIFHFTYQGWEVVLEEHYYESGIAYYRLIIPNIYAFSDSNISRCQMLEIVNKATEEYRVVKAFCQEDRIWIATEILISPQSDFDKITEQCLDWLSVAAWDIQRSIRQELQTK